MEVRTLEIRQVMIYKLVMNPMRGRCEDRRIAVAAYSEQPLRALLESEKVEPYKDPGPGGHGNELTSDYSFHKVFRPAGLLEWYNPPHDDEDPVESEWVDRDWWESEGKRAFDSPFID